MEDVQEEEKGRFLVSMATDELILHPVIYVEEVVSVVTSILDHFLWEGPGRENR